MTNVIIDSHQKIFYRTAGLEISSHENISIGAFYKIRGTPPWVFFYKTSFFCICIRWRTVRWKKVKLRILNHVFWKHSFNNYLKSLSTLFVILFYNSVRLWVSSFIEMWYKTVNTLLIREKDRPLTAKRARKNWLTYIRWSLFKSKIILNFLTHLAP